MDKITVIIPAYNAAQTIESTIQSVLIQTYSNFEIIVVDDGSTDDTVAIVHKIKDQRLKIHTFSHGGTSYARNIGLVLATGHYISFLDADDIWMRNKLSEQYEVLQVNQWAAVAYSWVDVIDELGHFVRKGHRFSKEGEVLPELILGNWLECGSNILVRRDALDAIHGFDHSLSASADWDCYLRLATKYQFVSTKQVHVFYRIRKATLSTCIDEQEKDSLAVLDKVFQVWPELEHLRPLALSNLYKYLAFKSIEFSQSKKQVGMAIYYMNQCLHSAKGLISPVLLLVFIFKASLYWLFPSNGFRYWQSIKKIFKRLKYNSCRTRRKL
jgi:glycosyltransferase involved in cell wall biosynthesis